MRPSSIALGVLGVISLALAGWVVALQDRVALLEAGRTDGPAATGPSGTDPDTVARLLRLEARVEELRASRSVEASTSAGGSGNGPGGKAVPVDPAALEEAVEAFIRRKTAEDRRIRYYRTGRGFVARLEPTLTLEEATGEALATMVGQFLDARDRTLGDPDLRGDLKGDAVVALEDGFKAQLSGILTEGQVRFVLEKLNLAVAGHGAPLEDGRRGTPPSETLMPEDRPR